jgi:hypothetical protein
MLVEDHYEVDPRYSVEECLGDMQRVIVNAKKVVKTDQKMVNGKPENK